ncbi:Transcriptional regulatory protein LiaR [Aquisphaera giovannonii]|uniref:Transcriptional regulatory protein LiaR n=1 Tax=Aquisphaera giovannonii TaxID=406548 RepID=A0A5B9VU02_9BACT|nr:response regulator transcription factor [Aquisphaera giovannonii]QEH32026.1 Transcriptional regulatory protein LiaR [Aquisphaera giovannonii]
MESIRVLIVEEFPLFRLGLRSLLRGVGGISVIAEAGAALQVRDLVEALVPDVLLVDIDSLSREEVDLVAAAARDFPGTKCLALSSGAEREQMCRAVFPDSVTILSKHATEAELELAVRLASAGRRYDARTAWGRPPAADPPAEDRPIRTQAHGARPTDGAAHDPLTLRQREILVLIARGVPNKGIASRLGISIKTVETHRLQLMKRLDIHDTAGLVCYAIRKRMIDPTS